MKRAWRVVRLSVFALIGGVVVSALVAEGIGVSGAVRYDGAAAVRFVAVQGMYVNVGETKGTGWSLLWWELLDLKQATYRQYIGDRMSFTSKAYKGEFVYEEVSHELRCDPPDALPGWSRAWCPKNWPQTSPTNPSVWTGVSTEVAVGWPFRSLSMHLGQSPPLEWQGGIEIGAPKPSARRLLFWRPIPLGLAADTLFYAAGIAGLVGGGRLFVRGRRRRRGACTACGYDRRGLAAGAACPECGRG